MPAHRWRIPALRAKGETSLMLISSDTILPAVQCGGEAGVNSGESPTILYTSHKYIYICWYSGIRTCIVCAQLIIGFSHRWIFCNPVLAAQGVGLWWCAYSTFVARQAVMKTSIFLLHYNMNAAQVIDCWQMTRGRSMKPCPGGTSPVSFR